jgi:hypothetical protein
MVYGLRACERGAGGGAGCFGRVAWFVRLALQKAALFGAAPAPRQRLLTLASGLLAACLKSIEVLVRGRPAQLRRHITLAFSPPAAPGRACCASLLLSRTHACGDGARNLRAGLGVRPGARGDASRTATLARGSPADAAPLCSSVPLRPHSLDRAPGIVLVRCFPAAVLGRPTPRVKRCGRAHGQAASLRQPRSGAAAGSLDQDAGAAQPLMSAA